MHMHTHTTHAQIYTHMHTTIYTYTYKHIHTHVHTHFTFLFISLWLPDFKIALKFSVHQILNPSVSDLHASTLFFIMASLVWLYSAIHRS